MRNFYETIYTVKVISSMRPEFWYANKIGREFEGKIEKIGKNDYYRIDSLHKILTEDCQVMHIQKRKLYQKY